MQEDRTTRVGSRMKRHLVAVTLEMDLQIMHLQLCLQQQIETFDTYVTSIFFL